MGCPGTRAPVWPPACVTSLELTLVCDSFLHNCNMGFPWLRVLFKDKNDCSDFCPDLVSASRCTCSLQGPLGTPVVHGPEPAGVASPSSCTLQALVRPWGQCGLWGACAVPLSLASPVWPGWWESVWGGMLAFPHQMFSCVSRGSGNPKAENRLGCVCLLLR